MKTFRQIKAMKLIILGTLLIFMTNLSRANGVAGSGGTYYCQTKNGKIYTLQELTQSKDLRTAFGDQLYNEYSDLASKANNISENLKRDLNKLMTSEWILLSQYDCDIQSNDQIKIGPLRGVIKPLIDAGFNTYWVHKDFLKNEFNGPTSDINRKRLISLINEAIVSFNQSQMVNTARWAAEASVSIYFILTQPHTDTELKALKDRLSLIYM